MADMAARPHGGDWLVTRNDLYTGPSDPFFAREVAAFPGAERVESCMQCGVCSGSCPMVDRMPDTPRRLMAHILAGDRERALSSPSLWFCASCFTCSVRCPKGISPADVMFALRSLARERQHNVSTAFYGRFTGHVKQYGRVYEAGVALTAAAHGGLRSLLRNAPLGIGLVRRGRLHLVPHRIQGAAEVAHLAEAVARRTAARRGEAKV